MQSARKILDFESLRDLWKGLQIFLSFLSITWGESDLCRIVKTNVIILDFPW